jgi:hypothetical protein
MELLKKFNENLENIKKSSEIYQIRNTDRYKGREM